jgi:hypothetical protein
MPFETDTAFRTGRATAFCEGSAYDGFTEVDLAEGRDDHRAALQ